MPDVHLNPPEAADKAASIVAPISHRLTSFEILELQESIALVLRTESLETSNRVRAYLYGDQENTNR